MSPRLKVSGFVIEVEEDLKHKDALHYLPVYVFKYFQRLSKLEEGSLGFLLGIEDGDLTYALGIVKQFNDTAEENNRDPYDLCNYDIVSNLPANINFCGVFHAVKGDIADSSIFNKLFKKIEVSPVVISYDLTSKELISCIYEDGLLKKTEYAVINDKDLLKSFLHLRLTAMIPLSCDFQDEKLEEAFNFIHKKIINGNSAFHILDSDVYILGDESINISGISSESTLENVFSLVNQNVDNKNESGINILNVSLYLKGSNNDKSPQLAPLIKYVKKIYKHAAIQLSLDSLAVVPTQLKLKQLYPILVESVSRNLVLNKQSLLGQLKSSTIRNVSIPETYHFFPPTCGHFLTIVYPAKQTSEQLKKFRETLHQLLSLPMDKPLFRHGNAFDFSQADKKSSKHLILNPHEGLPNSGVPDGEPYLVQGTYAYHHYMQDKFDDNGWGCAYRSLQTIFSWFKFQGYTNMPVPSHKEIQQCLVNIGDKPSSFVGSKQWIGSTEVSFVLDTMLGITCRIVNVSSGEEMTMKGGELSYHFKTQGTPVMIGGGVLAHTILGVDYNKKTGAIKFLILDPHYTGEENLKVIQSKGWCGWKGPEFWKKDAFYNMCLPLKPKCV